MFTRILLSWYSNAYSGLNAALCHACFALKIRAYARSTHPGFSIPVYIPRSTNVMAASGSSYPLCFYGVAMISTRRFVVQAASVSLLAAGSVSPAPSAAMAAPVKLDWFCK